MLANDVPVEGQLDPSTLTISTDPAHGQAIPQADGTITYIPDANFYGSDSFWYTITDTQGNVSAPSTVVVRVVESGLENPILFGDVDASGKVTSRDALLIINHLARSGQRSIPVLPAERGPNFYDANGSLVITALDALFVINHIGEDAPIVAGELVEQPTIANLTLSDDEDTEWQSIDAPLVAPVIDSSGQQKLVGASADQLVDGDVLDLLAEAQKGSDESEATASLTDQAILDLQ